MISRSDALFTNLMLDLEFPDGDPSPFSNYRDYAKAYLARDVYKKLLTRISDQADQRALEKFKTVNTRCAVWEMEYSGSWDEELVGSLKETIYKFWNPEGYPLVSSFASVLDRARPGPGASLGATGNDFYSKMFSSKLSCTSQHLYDTYRAYVSDYPLWQSAELCREAHYGSVDVVQGNRLSYVPKTNDISRTICIEPSLNMFYQLGFGARLEDRLGQFFGIDLSRQPVVNRELARLGSVCGGFATIDLSSASDSLGLKMLREVLPGDMLDWLLRLRSPYSDVGGEVLELAMVSTMGNGFTFPLQTMLFASVVATAFRFHHIKLERAKWSKDGALRDPGNFSVFGDDIIVPTLVAKTVITLLERLGFQVNTSKTFVEGPFRESCGHDYFNGHNVRPVYIRSLATQQDRYVAINLFNEWSARTGISLSNTVQFLISTVRYLAVPFAENQDAGIRLPQNLVSEPIRMSENGSCLYRASVARPTVITVLDNKVVLPRSRRRKQVIYNPDGLFLTMLRGDMVSGKIPVRHDRAHYHTRKKVTPYWDYFPPMAGLTPVFTWRQWNTAVFFNLYG